MRKGAAARVKKHSAKAVLANTAAEPDYSEAEEEEDDEDIDTDNSCRRVRAILYRAREAADFRDLRQSGRHPDHAGNKG